MGSINENTLLNGRYRLVTLKGRGSFGEVWLARDEQTDMDVAVKVYIALDERGLEEFKAEYKNSYSLNHPNLLHAYHFDVVDRQPFLVMPYCPDSAESLAGNTDEKTLLRFLRGVASGLDFLHSRNIIHRDIKPDNVLINQEGNFVITDFGVSSKMKSTLRRNSTRAMSGSDIAGTIGYMAPELFSRTPDAVKATDIWALGATVYEMATGELPFFGQGGALLLRGADVPEMRGEWSDGFRNIVEACLAKDIWDRPTAAKLVEWADDLLKGRPVSFNKPTASAVDTSATVRIQTPVAEPQVAPVVTSENKPAPSAYTVAGKNEPEKPKKHSFGKILLVVAIIAGLGGLLKVAMTPRAANPGAIDKLSVAPTIPSGKSIYHGVAYLNGGKSVKIKRIELDFGTKEGRSYYSDKPLFLKIEMSHEDSQTKLIITETNPDMKALSALGGKVSSIYRGVLNADYSVTGNGKNWKGEGFSFVFFPGEAKEEKAEKPVADTIKTTEKDINNPVEEKVKSEPEKPQVETKKVQKAEEPVVASQPSSKQIAISQESAALHVGEKLTLKITGYDGSIVWESDNPSIATVSQSGVVEGVKAGTTTIWAKIPGNYLMCKVTVSGSVSSSPSLLEKRVISGKVRNSDGKPLMGVSVKLKGTDYGAKTDANGYYSLMATTGDCIIVSGTGFKTIEKMIQRDSEIDFILYSNGSSSSATQSVIPTTQVSTKKKVSGYVRDELGNSIVGAMVLVRGTTNGTVVDVNGVYSIMAVPGDVLVFSSKGYQEVAKTVGNESRIDAILSQGKSKRR